MKVLSNRARSCPNAAIIHNDETPVRLAQRRDVVPLRPIATAVDCINTLLVEDNDGDAVLVREMLTDAHATTEAYNVRVGLTRASHLSEAISLLEHGSFQLILLDLSLPDAEGFDALDRLQLAVPSIPIIVLTGLSDRRVAKSALAHGAQDFLVKGDVEANVLARSIIYSVQRRHAEDERLKLQERLSQAEALEHLGILAGGLAHDFNNMLQGVLGYTALGSRISTNEKVREQFNRIDQVVVCARELVSKLFAFSNRASGELPERKGTCHLNISQFVEDTVNMVQGYCSPGIQFHYELSPKLPLVEVDPTEVRQVVLNLLTNACEAIGDEQGKVTIRTGVMRAGGKSNKQEMGIDVAEGFYVYLEVSDSGLGMDAETQKKVFEPFFTTKAFGNGLGLASVLGIVQSYGGTVTCESEHAKGTAFRVLFPCVTKEGPVTTV